MYNFIDIDGKQESKDLPSQSVIIEGKPLEYLVEGFRTLSVSGRGIRSRNINAVDIEGRDGSLFLGSNLEPVELVVRYKLEAKTNEEFRYKFNKLNEILHKEQFEIKIYDELEYNYRVTLLDADDVPDNSNSVISSFTLFCADGYKYTDPFHLEGENQVISYIDSYNTIPLQITANPKVDTSGITIRTQDKEIKLVQGSFLANHDVTIDFKEDITVTSANGNDTDKITLESDLEDFFIKKGEPIEFVEGGTIKVSVRKIAI